jgi:hypothetical protein
MQVPERHDKIRYLVRDRFPDHLRLREADQSDARAQELQKYEAELKTLPVAALDDRYLRFFEQREREGQEAELRDDQLEFFSRPGASADFRYWCALENWSPDEASALLLGKDPHQVSPERLKEVRYHSPFRRKFEDLRRKVVRAIEDGGIQEQEGPSGFLRWAEKTGMSVPAELSAQLQPAFDAPIDGRMLASLQVLIIGMAKRFYDYDPALAKNPVPARIVNDLSEYGLELSQETVRTHLREAARRLPDKHD